MHCRAKQQNRVIRILEKNAGNENWNLVDNIIKFYLPLKFLEYYLDYAENKALNSSNENIRDLGMSIIEKAYINKDRFESLEPKIYSFMLNDENPYVRFRSAFALINHNTKNYHTEIGKVLKEAKKEEDLASIVKHYEIKYEKL